MSPELRLEPITLVGTYVRLEPLRADHAPALLESCRDQEIWRWMLIEQPTTLEAMQDWLSRALRDQDQGHALPFIQIDPPTGGVIGTTRYMDVRPCDRSLEIGWTWLAPTFRRTAANTESKFLLLEHAFERLGAKRVQLKTDVRNEMSRRAIERIGAQFEGVLRNYQRRFDGTVRDTAMYSIIDADWPQARGALLSRLSS
ncbi:MAG: GNAT family N-acetyltransferase [Fimbriimonadaceae bacterium]|nr:GNAT family N-acetyltransferase [Fimbriimonadaceae bacterium]